MSGDSAITSETLAAQQACIDHSRDLLNAATAVLAQGHPHIAYHLAALALEELGRRELLGVQALAQRKDVPPAWPLRQSESHVHKLFWAFFGGSFGFREITKESLEQMRGFAEHVHSKRLGGLYVNVSPEGIGIPAKSIGEDETQSLINLVNSRLKIATAEKPRESIPVEELEAQSWFLEIADDQERRRVVFSKRSMEKLAEFKNAREWVNWLRDEFAKAEEEGRAALQEELNRKRPIKGNEKKKWKIRIRIFSDSHSIRPKTLNKWNETVDWIKLIPVSNKKDQLLVEFILLDNIPIQELWHFGWGLARHFVTALNIGTMGFFWWRLPQQISRYYESLEDLEKKSQIVIERNPRLKVDWGANRVLTEADLGKVSEVFAALPSHHNREDHGPYNYYIGGLTFLAINDIHWQCEINAFGNFLNSLQEMMLSTGQWARQTSFVETFSAFLDMMWPELDERDKYIDLIQQFPKVDPHKLGITLKEASFMKLFCDAYFLKEIRPNILRKKTTEAEEQ